ncbi:MAG: FlgD immunoglobulin-like domain containing protein [bacterium]
MIGLITMLFFSQLDHFGFGNINSPQVAGTPFPVDVHAYDATGSPYPFNGYARIYTSWDIPINPQYCDTLVLFSNGDWTGDITVSLAVDTLSLVCDDGGGHIGTSNQIQVLANTPARLLSILPGQQHTPGLSSGRTGNATNQIAGGQFDITLFITDDWFNIVDTVNHTISYSSTDPFAMQAQVQLVNGTITLPFAFRTAGPQHRLFFDDVTATFITPDTSSPLAIGPGSYGSLLVILDGETPLPGDTTSATLATPGKSGVPQDKYVNEDFGVLIYATDSMWNRTSATGYAIQLRSYFPFSNPSPENLENGEAQFTVSFSTAEDNTPLWVEDNANSIISYQNYLDILAYTDTTVAPDSFFAYPNPLGIENSTTMNFVYYLSGSCNVIFAIYDPFGNLVYKDDIGPGSEGAQSGRNSISWDGRNDEDARVASGLYYAVIKGWTHTATIFEKKMKVGVVW